MAKLPRYSLAHDDKSKRWVLKHEGTGKSVKTFGTKAAATRVACWRRLSVARAPFASESAMAKFKKSEPIRAAQIRAALGVRWRSAEPDASCVTRTGYQVIVHHAGRLHEGVDDCRSAKLEAARLKLLGDQPREFRLGGNLCD